LYLIEKNDNKIFIDGQVTNLSKLRDIWTGIIILSEKIDNKKTKDKEDFNWLQILSGGFIIGFIIFNLLRSSLNMLSISFLLFNVLGLLFALRTHRDLLNWENKLTEKICGITKSECDTIFQSNKWKILEKIKLNDISLVLFSTQLLSFLFFNYLGNTENFYFFFHKFLIASIPIIILSIFYQGAIIKQWCAICLSISGILITQLFITSFVSNKSYSTNSVFIIIFILSLVTYIWILSKKHLLAHQAMKETLLKLNSFKRNYSLFQNSLLNQKITTSPIDKGIIIGNNHFDKLEITLVTNLHCIFCKKAHLIIDDILAKFKNDLKIRIIFSADRKKIDKETELLYLTLIQISKRNKKEFYNALSDWFDDTNLERWLRKYREEITINPKILDEDLQWCRANGFNFTPVMTINNFTLPTYYQISDIPYLISELLNDDSLKKDKKVHVS